MSQHYLDILRKPELATIFKDAYLPQAGGEENIEPHSAQASGAADVSTVPEQDVEVPAAYPMVQPMKAAFHFDSVEGFGEWQILVSTRADRNLREYKRSDQKIFAIILKKIK